MDTALGGGAAGPPRPVARPVHAVIFDMDGTLVQTRYASWEVFHEVSRQFDLGFDSPEQYFELFQHNIYTELAKRCRDDEQYRQVKEVFLERLQRHYHPVMIPGMLAVVRQLASVATLALLSSNALPVVRRVLVENDLAFCFAHAFGGDTVPDKRTAIRQFLADAGSGFGRRCTAGYDEQMAPVDVAAEGTVLVTDTAGDVQEALAEGIRAVGVAWGMHGVDQLLDAGAEFVALWPQEVGSYLGRAIEAPPRGACALPGAGIGPGAHPAPTACCDSCASRARCVGREGCAGGTSCTDCPGPGTGPARAGHLAEAVDASTVSALIRRDRRARAVEQLLGHPLDQVVQRHEPHGAPAPAKVSGPSRCGDASAELAAAVRRICS